MQWEVANGLIIVGTVDTVCLVFFIYAMLVVMLCSEPKHPNLLCSCSLYGVCLLRSLLVSVVYFVLLFDE